MSRNVPISPVGREPQTARKGGVPTWRFKSLKMSKLEQKPALTADGSANRIDWAKPTPDLEGNLTPEAQRVRKELSRAWDLPKGIGDTGCSGGRLPR